MAGDRTGDVSRRQFLKRTGQGLMAAPMVGALACGASASQTGAAGRKAGWAFVGLGNYATNIMMPAIANCRRTRVAALVSGHPEKAREVADKYGVSAKSIYSYETFDQIRDNPDVDVVYVVLPNSMHAEYAIRAARAGKHVFCEKPMALTTEECREMIDACKKANVRLAIDYRCRFEPNNRFAIETVRGGSLGTTRTLSIDHGFNIGDPSQWRLKRALAGGGSLVDIGIYSLQAARYLTGEEPTHVSAFLESAANDPRFKEVEENVTFQLRFPSGAIANCSSSYGYAAQSHYRVIGTKGWIDLEPATFYGGHKIRVFDGDSVADRTQPGPPDAQFSAIMDHFSECVVDGKEPLTPGEEGLRDVEIMTAIYEAARSGKTIRI